MFTLRLGSTGNSVRMLRYILGLPIAGVFDNRTQQAVESFQKTHNLVIDGIVGNKTWKVLFEGIKVRRANNIKKWFNIVIPFRQKKSMEQAIMDLFVCSNRRKQHIKYGIKLIKKHKGLLNLDSKEKLAYWLGEMLQETGIYYTIHENFNYRCEKLPIVFKYYRGKHKKEAYRDGYCNRHGARRVMIASKVYAFRIGNGSIKTQDGWRYCGKGSAALTGKDNYKEQEKWAKQHLDDFMRGIVKNPNLLTKQEYSFISGAIFWAMHTKNMHLNGRKLERYKQDMVTRKYNKYTDSYNKRWKNAVHVYSLIKDLSW